MWVSLLLVISTLILVFFTWKGAVIRNMPGPEFVLPLVGHLPFLGNEPYKTFLKWCKFYGPMFCVQLGNLRTVVLNDVQLIKDVFSIPETAGRPPLESYNQACDKKGLLFSSGDAVFEQRKFFAKNVRKFCYEDRGGFQSLILQEVSQLLAELEKHVEKPYKRQHQFDVPVINTIWASLMGKRFDYSDPYLKKLISWSAHVNDIDGVLANLGLFIPAIARWFPNATKFNKQLFSAKSVYGFVDKEWHAGSPGRVVGEPRNYREAWMDESENAHFDSSFHVSKNCFSQTMGDILLASTEAVGTTLDWTLLYMALYPEVQAKLQRELDRAAETKGLITLQDRKTLPYLQAIIHEVFRASALGPMGISHYTTDECKVRGVTIPANTCILPNLYSLYHDPAIWDKPHEFRPERFLDKNNELVNTEKIPAFAVGKRKCIGESIARDILFLFIGNIFYKFKVSCTNDRPDMKPINGFVLRLKPFEVVYSRRM